MSDDERKFIHDIANSLNTLNFQLEDLEFKFGSQSLDDNILQIQKIRFTLGTAISALEDRREILIERGVPKSKK